MESNRECIIVGCANHAELHQAVCLAHAEARTDAPQLVERWSPRGSDREFSVWYSAQWGETGYAYRETDNAGRSRAQGAGLTVRQARVGVEHFRADFPSARMTEHGPQTLADIEAARA